MELRAVGAQKATSVTRGVFRTTFRFISNSTDVRASRPPRVLRIDRAGRCRFETARKPRGNGIRSVQEFRRGYRPFPGLPQGVGVPYEIVRDNRSCRSEPNSLRLSNRFDDEWRMNRIFPFSYLFSAFFFWERELVLETSGARCRYMHRVLE